MRASRLGQSAVEVTQLGFGGGPLGGLFAPLDDDTAFPLRHPVVAGIVVGIRSAEEARRNAEAFAAPVPAQVWADLRGEGLLDERAPAQ